MITLSMCIQISAGREQLWEEALIIAVWSTLHHSVHVCMILQLHDKDPKCKGDQCKCFDRFKIGGVCTFPLAIIVAYFIVARHEPL